jgi:uncharacterized lipoprotein NlpE involved in copper resistance
MKVILTALLVTTMLAGCSFNSLSLSSTKNIRKCTLGCGEFEITERNGVTYARTVDKQTLNIPPYINNRPEIKNEK